MNYIAAFTQFNSARVAEVNKRQMFMPVAKKFRRFSICRIAKNVLSHHFPLAVCLTKTIYAIRSIACQTMPCDRHIAFDTIFTVFFCFCIFTATIHGRIFNGIMRRLQMWQSNQVIIAIPVTKPVSMRENISIQTLIILENENYPNATTYS